MHLLAGELAEDGGDVGGVGGHQSADGALHLVRYSTATLGNQFLQVKDKNQHCRSLLFKPGNTNINPSTTPKRQTQIINVFNKLFPVLNQLVR